MKKISNLRRFVILSLLILQVGCSSENTEDRFQLAQDAYHKNQLDMVMLLLDGKDLNQKESEIYLKSLFYRNEFKKFLDKTNDSIYELSPEIFLYRMKACLLVKQKLTTKETILLENYTKVSPEALLLFIKLSPPNQKSEKIDILGTKIQEFHHYLSLMQNINLRRKENK